MEINQNHLLEKAVAPVIMSIIVAMIVVQSVAIIMSRCGVSIENSTRTGDQMQREQHVVSEDCPLLPCRLW